MKRDFGWFLLMVILLMGGCKRSKYTETYEERELRIYYTTRVDSAELQEVKNFLFWIGIGVYKPADVFFDKDESGYSLGMVTAFQLPSDVRGTEKSACKEMAEELSRTLGDRFILKLLDSKGKKVLFTTVGGYGVDRSPRKKRR